MTREASLAHARIEVVKLPFHQTSNLNTDEKMFSSQLHCQSWFLIATRAKHFLFSLNSKISSVLLVRTKQNSSLGNTSIILF